MIEFKAECGHTVRVRDEDAGGVVRCSYCGRNAAVPDNTPDANLDFLFKEIEESAAVGAARSAVPRRSFLARWWGRRRVRRREAFDPFALVLKLCYAAGLFILVYVVAVKALIPLWKGEGFVLPTTGKRAEPAATQETSGRKEPPKSRGPGLIGEKRQSGVYVASVPTGANVYCLEQAKAPPEGRIWKSGGVRQFRSDGVCPSVTEGSFVVEVSLPWIDRSLSRYRGYWDFRRAVEAASPEGRRKLLSDYFLPDEASDVFIDEAEDQVYIVRQYKVDAQRDQLKGIRALFLPRIVREDGRGFLVEPLVREYLTSEKKYEFDEDLVRNELAYYGVAESDRGYVIDALGRVGSIPYMTSDGRIRLFKIGINDGVFATKIVREPEG